MDEPDDGEQAFNALVAEREHARRKMAHHEGGHIAVAWALGAWLQIGKIARDGLSGEARFRLGSDGAGASVDRVTAILAGPIAERRFAPFEEDSGSRDREQVAEQLNDLCRCPAAAAIVLAHCKAEAQRLVDAEWQGVEALAEAFLERDSLTSSELDEILTDVAERRRREHWRTVEIRTGARCGATTGSP